MIEYKQSVRDLLGYIKELDKLGVDMNSVEPKSYDVLTLHNVSVRPVGHCRNDIKMFVSIRTDITNEIIVDREGNFYWDCTQSFPTELFLDEAALVAAKSLVLKVFNCGKGLHKVIVRTSAQPVGAIISESEVCVYVNVVIDHTLKHESFFKIDEGYKFIKIRDLIVDGNNKFSVKLRESLRIVRGDK